MAVLDCPTALLVNIVSFIIEMASTDELIHVYLTCALSTYDIVN
jgi:hypothetical protein